MKKLIFLLIALPFLFSCSDDNTEETQDYTSYVIKATGTSVFTASRTAYFNEEGLCILLDSIGDLNPDADTKEYILSEHHDEIYLFYTWGGGSRLRSPFKLQENKKNIIKLTEDNWKGMTIEERTQYNWPH